MTTDHDRIALFLAYPQARTLGELEDALAALDRYAGVAGSLAAFLEKISGLSLAEWQELYTRSFDLNPTCCLETGWHLYGESYMRGAFIAHMRAAMRKTGLPEDTELPDHLSHVISVLGRLEPAEAERMARNQALPALEKMRTAIAAKENPYEHVLDAVIALAASHGTEIQAHA